MARRDDNRDRDAPTTSADEPAEEQKVIHTDVGVSIQAKITRGSGTRDQEKYRLKAKGETVEEAEQRFDQLVEKVVGKTGDRLRAWEPDANSDGDQ